VTQLKSIVITTAISLVMKRPILLAAIACSLWTTSSIAQDKIELYSNFEGTECAISEIANPPLKIYVWLTGPIQATGARFSVPKPACWQNATWVGDELSPSHLSIGNSQADWSIGFFAGSGGCIASHTPPIFIGSIDFVAIGLSVPCCEVTAKPGFEFVFTDCAFSELPLSAGQSVFINANESCPCQSAIATQPATWGRVKSLYR
jgi:hypothetical protein